MARLILVNIGLGCNWVLFLLSIVGNFTGIYLAGEPLIPWIGIMFWFLINITYSVIMTTFYVDVEISEKTIRDKSPITSNFLKEVDKVAEPVTLKKLLVRKTTISKKQTPINKEQAAINNEPELVVE